MEERLAGLQRGLTDQIDGVTGWKIVWTMPSDDPDADPGGQGGCRWRAGQGCRPKSRLNSWWRGWTRWTRNYTNLRRTRRTTWYFMEFLAKRERLRQCWWQRSGGLKIKISYNNTFLNAKNISYNNASSNAKEISYNNASSNAKKISYNNTSSNTKVLTVVKRTLAMRRDVNVSSTINHVSLSKNCRSDFQIHIASW